MHNIIEKKTLFCYCISLNYKEYAKSRGLNQSWVYVGLKESIESLIFNEERIRSLKVYKFEIEDKEAFGYINISIYFISEYELCQNKHFFDIYIDYILEPLGTQSIKGCEISRYSNEIEIFILKYKLEHQLSKKNELSQIKI